jgi:hypothetical protein
VDACFALFAVLVVLAIITLVGHGVWVLIATLFKDTPGSRQPRAPSGFFAERQCEHCGNWYSSRQRYCPRCDFDPECVEAVQLRNLDITRQQLERLVRADLLRQANADPVLASIAQLKAQLEEQINVALGRRRGLLLPLTGGDDIRKLLASCEDVRELTAEERKRALAWYRTKSEPSWAEESPQVLLNLARLLRLAGLGSRALRLYELLVLHHRDFAKVGEAAVEGVTLASKLDDPNRLNDLAARALILPLTPEQRRAIESLSAPSAPRQAVPVAPLPQDKKEDTVVPADVSGEREAIPVVLPVARRPAPPPEQFVEGVEVVAESAPPPPRRSFWEMVAGFMEERNILWGELVGGLLIVGCSIALVISLRKTLEELPYFPFLIIAAVTAALIGAGSYTLSHWKLEATSRGLLVIGTMLVPLCFMVLAGLGSGRQGDWWELGTELATIGVFTWLVRGACNILIRPALDQAAAHTDWLATLAIVGASASQLLVPHLEDLPTLQSGLIGLVGYVPALLILLTHAMPLRGLAHQDKVESRQAGGLFLSLGLTLYAVGVAFGFVLYRADMGPALKYLAVPVTITGLPLVIGGTLVSARLASRGEGDGQTGGLPPGVAAVIATITALFGTLIMLLALPVAWPYPGRLIVIGLVNAGVLAAVAYRVRLTAAYVPAQLCLAVASLTAYHLLAGHLAVDETRLAWTLWSAWWTPESGVVLLALAGVLTAAAAWLTEHGRRPDGVCQAVTGGVFAIASLLVVAVDAAQSPGRVALVWSACAAGALLANIGWRQTWLTAVAAAVLFGAAGAARYWWDPQATFAHAWTWTSLLQATITVGLALAIERTGAGWTRSVFVVPLEVAALVASWLAIPGVINGLSWPWLAEATVATCWVAVLWCLLAWRWRQPALFAAFQSALVIAVLFGTGQLLQAQDWFKPTLMDLARDVRSWQACGVGLAALSLLWVKARFGLRYSERAWALLEPGWPAVDRCVLGGLVILQVLVAAINVFPAALEELRPLTNLRVSLPPDELHLHGPLGWLWLALLAAALLLAIFQGRAATALPALALVGMCVPVIMAASWWQELAVASALRWGLALAFVTGSAFVWFRNELAAGAHGLGIKWRQGVPIAGLVRMLFLAGLVLPVLGLSAVVALMGLAGFHTGGPAEGSFFHDIGFLRSDLVPLGLVCVGLTGHAMRERSAGHAFAGGLIALVGSVVGFALGVITTGRVFGTEEWFTLGQLATLVTAVWLLSWIGVRRTLPAAAAKSWITGAAPLPCRTMLLLQYGLMAATLLVWLLPAAWVLAFPYFVGPVAQAMKAAAGSRTGWVAFGVAVVAGYTLRRQYAATVSSSWLAIVGILTCCLAASTVSVLGHDSWDYRTLMLGMAGLSIGGAMILVRPSPPRWLQTSPGGVEEAGLVTGIGCFAVLLAVQTAVGGGDHLWAALACGMVATAPIIVALQRREEGWLFGSSGLAILAVSLIVWHIHLGQPLQEWVLRLIQLDLVTAAVFGIVWQLAIGRSAAFAESEDNIHPWLALQQLLISSGNGLLAVLGFAAIVLEPWSPREPQVGALGDWAGWLALATWVVGLIWFTNRFVRPLTAHGAAAATVVAGVLLGCTANAWDLEGNWLAYHVMTLIWALAAGGMLAVSWRLESNNRLSELRTGPRAWLLAPLLRAPAVQSWIIAVSALLVTLSVVFAAKDPFRPAWTCGMVLTVSLLAGALTVWTGRGSAVYASGLLLNVAGLLWWIAWRQTAGELPLSALIYRLAWLQALCFGAASLLWSIVEISCRRLGRLTWSTELPYRHLAGWLGLAGIVGIVLVALGSDYFRLNLDFEDPLGWLALTAVACAALATLWDEPGERLARPLPQLYLVGLVAIGLALHMAEPEPNRLLWAIMGCGGAYVAGAACVCTLCLYYPGLGQEIGMPARPKGWPLHWFVPAQVMVGIIVTPLAIWVVLTFDLLGERLAGALSMAGFLGAALLLMPNAPRLLGSEAGRSAWPRHVTLLLGVLVCILLHATLVSPATPAPWLHRTVLVMAALTWIAVVYGQVLPRWPGPASTWSEAGRRQSIALGIAACFCLGLALVQEFLLYDRGQRTTPLVWPAVTLVAVALLVLIAGALRFALSSAADMLKLSESRRSLYVYAAEVLFCLLFVHLRLNIPFTLGKYGYLWPFIVMGIAFAGVGLSEVFQRRGLAVLAGPLQRTAMFLPLLPIVAYMLKPLTELHRAAGEAVAGSTPFMRYLDSLEGGYQWHALLWFLMGTLYLVIALSRRSSNLALVAVLIANVGLWVLFGHQEGLAFFVHPQLWLIPVGAIVLVAEHVNRQHLQPPQSIALRYAGLMLIYVSSTADMFIAGLGHNVLMPIVLALLAVAGVLLGILLRVRAFLFLGVTFLFLVVFSQIWHAAVDQAQTWVWWASGIVLGVAILTLFALFEKRRNDVLNVIQELKRWK